MLTTSRSTSRARPPPRRTVAAPAKSPATSRKRLSSCSQTATSSTPGHARPGSRVLDAPAAEPDDGDLQRPARRAHHDGNGASTIPAGQQKRPFVSAPSSLRSSRARARLQAGWSRRRSPRPCRSTPEWPSPPAPASTIWRLHVSPHLRLQRPRVHDVRGDPGARELDGEVPSHLVERRLRGAVRAVHGGGRIQRRRRRNVDDASPTARRSSRAQRHGRSGKGRRS